MGQARQDGMNDEARTAEGRALTDRRDVLLRGAVLSAAAVATPFATAGCSRAAEQPAAAEQRPDTSAGSSLYERLGGIFAIAGVVNYFSDEIIEDPVAGARSRNPALRKWHTESLDRLPGLKFMRTLWVANVAGGPYQYTPTRPGSTNLGLEEAHRDLKISSEEFDAVAGVLSRSLDHFEVPEKEKSEVLSAFAAHKAEVTRGSQG